MTWHSCEWAERMYDTSCGMPERVEGAYCPVSRACFIEPDGFSLFVSLGVAGGLLSRDRGTLRVLSIAQPLSESSKRS